MPLPIPPDEPRALEAPLLHRIESAKLLQELNRAHAEGPTAEELELRRIAKRRHRDRLKEW